MFIILDGKWNDAAERILISRRDIVARGTFHDPKQKKGVVINSPLMQRVEERGKRKNEGEQSGKRVDFKDELPYFPMRARHATTSIHAPNGGENIASAREQDEIEINQGFPRRRVAFILYRQKYGRAVSCSFVYVEERQNSDRQI